MAHRGLSRGADGAELQLVPIDNPAAKATEQAMFRQGQPAAMLYVDDVDREYEPVEEGGAELTTSSTHITISTIAVLNYTCGYLIWIVALDC